jgi:hypothetical protein
VFQKGRVNPECKSRGLAKVAGIDPPDGAIQIIGRCFVMKRVNEEVFLALHYIRVLQHAAGFHRFDTLVRHTSRFS